MQAAHSALPRPRLLRRGEYERMAEIGFFRGERVELIHGTVFHMTPIGPRHASIVDRLTRLLVLALRERAWVRVQHPLLADGESEPEPDVAIVPAGSYAERHPDSALLVIEVADTSLDHDRGTKSPLYAASGVADIGLSTWQPAPSRYTARRARACTRSSNERPSARRCALRPSRMSASRSRIFSRNRPPAFTCTRTPAS